jgi:tRNA A37 threonylcarbamoyladenosine synthetase subunit TsaC/SUA5/YrdC
MVSSKLMLVSPGLEEKAVLDTLTPLGMTAAPTHAFEVTTVSLRIVKEPLVLQLIGPSAAAVATVGVRTRKEERTAATMANESLTERLECIIRTGSLARMP